MRHRVVGAFINHLLDKRKMNNIDPNKDYYNILGIDKNATEEDINRVYKQLSKKWHPDLQHGKSDAEKEEAKTRFQEINEAHEILSDKNARANYDRLRSGFGRGMFGGLGDMARDFMRQNGFGSFHDIFGDEDDFGNRVYRGRNDDRTPRDGQNIKINVNLSFESFFFGCTKTLSIKVDNKCSHCKNGTTGGEPEYENCPTCGGSGWFNERHGNLLMRQTCSRCMGTGRFLKNQCPHCRGTTVDGTRIQTCEFVIPKFSYTGFSTTFYGLGNCGKFGGQSGDITIVAHMDDTGRFYLARNYDTEMLATSHYVPVIKALYGGKEQILTPYGYEEIELPPCFSDGSCIVVPNKGLKKQHSNGNADLIVKLVWDLPKDVSKADKKKLEELFINMKDKNHVFENTTNMTKSDCEYEKKIKELFGTK